MQLPASAKLPFHIYYLSEQAITIEFGQEIDEATHQQVTNFDNLLNQKPFPGFCTTVQAYATLSIFFDPLQVIKSDLAGVNCFEKVSGYLLELKEEQEDKAFYKSRSVTIPVCYGGRFGQDLEEVARLHNLTQQEVISLHTIAAYKVYMIGFVPGFAYLAGLSDLLETPRKAAPRPLIPAGSVGIAGKQTGVYPLTTPGGWQLIGRTPLVLFDPENPQPAFLKAGDYVTFKAISQGEFEQYSS